MLFIKRSDVVSNLEDKNMAADLEKIKGSLKFLNDNLKYLALHSEGDSASFLLGKFYYQFEYQDTLFGLKRVPSKYAASLSNQIRKLLDCNLPDGCDYRIDSPNADETYCHPDASVVVSIPHTVTEPLYNDCLKEVLFFQNKLNTEYESLIEEVLDKIKSKYSLMGSLPRDMDIRICAHGIDESSWDGNDELIRWKTLGMKDLANPVQVFAMKNVLKEKLESTSLFCCSEDLTEKKYSCVTDRWTSGIFDQHGNGLGTFELCIKRATNEPVLSDW